MLISALASAVLLQDTLGVGPTRLITIFIGIATLALFAQACAMVGMAIGAAKAQKKILAQVETLSEKLLPLIDKSNVLVTDLTPQIKDIATRAQTITGNVEDISGMVRDKVQEFGPTISAANQTFNEATVTARDANARTRDQVHRVDGMVTDVLNAASELGRAVEKGVRTPIREVSNLVEGVKIGILSFIRGNQR